MVARFSLVTFIMAVSYCLVFMWLPAIFHLYISPFHLFKWLLYFSQITSSKERKLKSPEKGIELRGGLILAIVVTQRHHHHHFLPKSHTKKNAILRFNTYCLSTNHFWTSPSAGPASHASGHAPTCCRRLKSAPESKEKATQVGSLGGRTSSASPTLELLLCGRVRSLRPLAASLSVDPPPPRPTMPRPRHVNARR